MKIATATIKAIDEALAVDQGAKYRGLLRNTLSLVEDAYDTSDERFRSHLGASLIGRKCDRELWLSFRWATAKRFEGQILRLFNRGHLEEGRFVALLQMIGCQVHQFDQSGNQFRITGHNGHYGSAIDSVIVGCPDIPNEPILGEFKTHNDKSFTKLTEAGVMAAKWEHFVQMQEYMAYYSLNWGLYLAVNKNDDRLHGEIVAYDPNVAAKYWNRAGDIINAQTPPKRISDSASWYECKFCDQRQVCHSKDLPQKTCRSCVHSRPVEEKQWVCTHPVHDAQYGDNVPLSKEDQATCLQGYCTFYEMIPEIKS